jgi:hypothetical protein
MAMSAAERQRAYRARRSAAGPDGNGERRISAWVSTSAALDLRRLARHRGCTIRAMLERLIADEVEKLIATLSDPEFDAFLELPTRTRRGPLARNADAKASAQTSPIRALERPTRDVERSEGGALSP